MYPTDLKDSQWQVIEKLLLDQRKCKYDLCQVLNAIFYVMKGGIPWRLMPKDLHLGKVSITTMLSFAD